MEISNSIKTAVINNELGQYLTAKYQLQLRYRINKELGETDSLKVIENDLTRIEKAMDILKAELETLKE